MIEDYSNKELFIEFKWTNSDGKEVATPISVSKMASKTAWELDRKGVKFSLGKITYI